MPNKVHYVKAGVDTVQFTEIESKQRKTLREKFGYSDTDTIVLHTGHMVEARNIRKLMDLDKSFRIILIISTSTRWDENLYNDLKQCPNIKIIHKYIPKIEEYFQIADVYYFPVEEVGYLSRRYEIYEYIAKKQNWYALFVNIEFYFEKTKYVMYVSVLGAALNVFLNWVFITKYGYIAAGYTTVFCYLLFSAGHYLLYKYLSKKYLAGISIINFKLIGAVTIALMIVMGAVLALYKITIARYGVIFAIILVAVAKRDGIIDTLKTVLSKKK